MARLSDILSIQSLPAMPTSLARLLPLLSSPDSEWPAIERIVRHDEALAAAVLRLANSGLYGRPGKRFELRASLMRLGRDALRRCVLQQQFSGIVGGDNAAFDLQRGALWRSSLAGALASEHLASVHGFDEPETAFLAALLRDIGKLALNIRYAGGYAAMVAPCADETLSFVQAERSALGFDHAQVGAALVRRWGLPEHIAAAIEAHHEPAPPGPGHELLHDLVHAGDTICRWAGLGVGLDGMEYLLAPHVRDAILDRKAAEAEIVLVWERLREAEESLSVGVEQGAVA